MILRELSIEPFHGLDSELSKMYIIGLNTSLITDFYYINITY